MVHLDLVLSRCCTSNLTMSDKSHERESRIGQGVLKEMGPGGGGGGAGREESSIQYYLHDSTVVLQVAETRTNAFVIS
jgi:hypothetical protein